MGVSFARKTMGVIMERFQQVCGIIGNMGKLCRKKKEIKRLSMELKSGEATLDNLLYEEFGMSGEDVAKVLFG